MLILASASPRRQQLLRQWKVKFKVGIPRVKESSRYKKPYLIVQDIARKKLLSLKDKYPGKVILSADTIVVLANKRDITIIGKPKNIPDARKILQRLSGTIHRVYTGVAVCSRSGKIYTDYAMSRVKVRKIPPKLLAILSRKHRDKAGAYAVQEKNDLLVEKVWGDYYNVVGLPGKVTRKLLRLVGIFIT